MMPGRAFGWPAGARVKRSSPAAAGATRSSPRSVRDELRSRTSMNSTTATAMIPASRNTAVDQAPVASRSAPLTAGDSTAPISPIRLFMPNAAPR
jgi:hypothetical protein